jgi:hypothetical protein
LRLCPAKVPLWNTPHPRELVVGVKTWHCGHLSSAEVLCGSQQLGSSLPLSFSHTLYIAPRNVHCSHLLDALFYFPCGYPVLEYDPHQRDFLPSANFFALPPPNTLSTSMVSLQPPSSSFLPPPPSSSPIHQTGPRTEHPILAPKISWNIEFIRRSTKINHHAPSHSISLIAQQGSAQWHVRITFLGEPYHTGQGTSQKTYWPKRWRDFKALCHCIDLDLVSLIDDKFTELLISPEPDLSTSTQPLPLKDLPSCESDYAKFRSATFWFHAQEYTEHTHYPLYIGSGHTVHLANTQRVKDIESFEHVYIARILGDEREYVYKGVDRLIYFPHDTKVIEQELRNLELFHGNKQIVQLVAAVISSSPYQTRETGAPPVLRGILFEYLPHGTLHDAIQFPEPWMHSSSWWLQWALDISMALAYMHQMGVTHMDLKPKNVAMSKEWSAVVLDVSGIGGTGDEWLLPELFESLDRCSESWELRVQSDTWALGKIMASMAKGMNDDGKEEEKLLLLQIAREVEQTRGCTSLAAISDQLSKAIASIGLNSNE